MPPLKKYGLFLLILLSLSACQNNKNNTNSWNKGKITIASDINLQPILDQLKPVFENVNKEAAINFNYLTEDSIIAGFKNGKYTSILISRMLTEKEKAEAEVQQQAKSIEKPFAYDAIAIVVATDFADSIISLEKLNDYLQPGSPIKLVFDKPQSGIARQIQVTTAIPVENFKNAFTLKNTDEVIAYVKSHKNSIGFIPYSTITNMIQYNQPVPVKIVPIQYKDTIYNLTQYDLSKLEYPLMRTLNFVLGRNQEQVANGFAHFLNREKAAKIFLKSGLVPKQMPVRNIVVTDKLKTD